MPSLYTLHIHQGASNTYNGNNESVSDHPPEGQVCLPSYENGI